MMRAVVILWISIVRSCVALFRSRQNQAIVELALRQQLAVYPRRPPRPRLLPLDRAFWVALSPPGNRLGASDVPTAIDGL
jgi:hypothetical protein